MTVNPLRILGAMGVVVLGSAFFACLSISLAGLVRNRDRLMGIGQAITMPLFFASNALYPVDVMPVWLRWLSAVNPLSYEVNALRGLLIGTPTQWPRSTSRCWSWPRSPASRWHRLCCAAWCAEKCLHPRIPGSRVANVPRRLVVATRSGV